MIFGQLDNQKFDVILIQNKLQDQLNLFVNKLKQTMRFFAQTINQKQHSINLKSSRTKSCANLESQPQQTNMTSRNLNKMEKNIYDLLHKRNLSCKKIFTDQTTYSYKPEISNLPAELYPDYRSQIQIPRQRIIERLVQNMKTKHENLKLTQLKKQQQDFKKNCSFLPKISESSKAIILAKLKTQGVAQVSQPFTRLYKQGLQKRMTNEKQHQIAKQRQVTQEHTFQPNINPTSKQILNNENRNLDPIYKRYEEILSQKRKQQKMIEEDKNKEIQEMAKVKIQNKNTLQILKKNQNYQTQKGSVVKRLLENYFKEKQQKINHLVVQKQQKQKKQCTFQPNINKNYLLMNASTFDPDQNFLDRQKQFNEAVKQNIQIKANQIAPTFKPQINKLSQLICKDRKYQNLEDKLNRLNYQPLFEKEAQIQELQKSVYKQCKFHPEINQISKALQGPLKIHSCNCHPSPQKFNFKPNINKKSRQIADNKPIQELNKQKKQEKINKIKMEREYNQLIECTFQPKIKSLNKEHLKLNENATDLVPGMKEFVEKKTQIMRKKIQDEKYKEKVFNLEKRYKSKTCTSVQEFQLSHKYYDGKAKKELLEEANEKFKKQHPFKPKIQFLR